MDVLTRMRTDWEQRAHEDPLHYIATGQRTLDAFSRSGRHDAELILDGLPRGGRVLEIGAGIGRLLVEMEHDFDQLDGVDISSRMVELSADYLADHPKVKILLNDGETLPYHDESFDLVFSYVTFQHIPERRYVERYISEAHRVLKTGGVFRFQVFQQSLRQRVLRPFGLAKPTTWEGYNWTHQGLSEALRDSPFRGGTIVRNGLHLWATTTRS